MADINGTERITMLDLYNKVTGQAWSMFDGEVESQEEFETNVTTSLNKALTFLYNSYKFPFRERTHVILTRGNKADYSSPEGNITQSVINGKKCFNVLLNNSTPLTYISNYRTLEPKTGTPEYFYTKQDKIYLYPTPDNKYIITIDYLSVYPVCDEEETEKAALENETDYINIPEHLNELFMGALMPLTMWNYLIASESDENSSAYQIQYERAYKQLIKYAKGIDTEKTIGWRD